MAAIDGTGGRDPGWGVALKQAWPHVVFPVPQLALGRMRRTGADVLTTVRVVFLSWLAAQLAIVAIVRLIAEGGRDDAPVGPGVFAGGVCLFGLLSFVFARGATPKFDGSGPAELAGSYQTRFFLRMALASSAFLMGFVGTFIVGEWWLVLVGLPFSLAGFAATVPTRSNLRRLQEKVEREGSTLDLLEVLLSTKAGVSP